MKIANIKKQYKLGLVLFLITVSFSFDLFLAKESNHDQASDTWKQMHLLENAGKSKSALKLAQEIYLKAQKEKNVSEQIKALVFQAKYTDKLNENGAYKAINLYEKNRLEAKAPLRNILTSLEAELLWRYYKQNRYKFLNRTETDSKSNDFRTWSLPAIASRVKELYLLSLGNSLALQNLSIDNFQTIIVQGKNDSNLRPTLYDFLMHRAIDFFSDQEASLSQVNVEFKADGNKLFKPIKQFIKHDTSAQKSWRDITIRLLQDLLKFRLKDKENSDALVMANIKRLQIAMKSSYLASKTTLYDNGLKKYILKIKRKPISSYVAFLVAKSMVARGRSYNAFTNKENQFKIKEAFDYCNRVINTFKKSFWSQYCKALNNSILHKALSFQLENDNLPLRPFAALVKYKNVAKVWFQISKLSQKNKKFASNLSGKKKIAFYLSLRHESRFSLTLPNPEDYQNHSIEMVMPILKTGRYVILASPNDKFLVNKSIVTYNETQISNIGYQYKSSRFKGTRFRFFSRKNGRALVDLKARLLTSKYNYLTQSYSFSESNEYNTDKLGMIYFLNEGANSSKQIRISYNGENYILNNSFYLSPKREEVIEKRYHTMFFSDRKIFRPGQVVHFKGIQLIKIKNKYSLTDKKSALVTLLDVNYKKIASLKVDINSYGSFSGKFMLPTGRLNGQFVIRESNSSHYFRVEEYKRPKFEVTIEPYKKKYQLHQTISLSGHAMMYSGANLDGASVKYSVVRNPRYLYSFHYWRAPRLQSTTIKTATTQTDSHGKFKLSVPLIINKNQKGQEDLYFNYVINASVTDLSGETHSSQTSINAGTTNWRLSANIPPVLDPDNIKKGLYISSVNLQGRYVPKKLKLEIHRLITPKRLINKRLWQRPEFHTLKKEKYIMMLPHNLYADETNFKNFQVADNVLEKTFLTTENGTIRLDKLKDLPEDNYLFVVKDAKGLKVFEKAIKLVSLSRKEFRFTDALFVKTQKNNYKPQETIVISWASKNTRASLFTEWYQGNKLLRRKLIQGNGQKDKITFKLTEKHRGGLTFFAYLASYNRSYSIRKHFNVGWQNKKLKIKITSMKSLLSPSKKETWRIKIRGPKNSLVAAETILGMYDQSLDTFASNYWSMDINPSYSSYESLRNYYYSTISSSSRVAGKWNLHIYYPTLSHYKMNWFGYYGYYSYRKSKHLRMRGGSVESFEESEMLDDDASPAPTAQLKRKSKKVAMETKLTSSKRNDHSSSSSKPNQMANFSIRKNLQETAFFFPQVKSNAKGEVVFSFTAPEALTRWKFMMFAHTKDLKIGSNVVSVVTQKKLMANPHVPRFLRTGDAIIFSSRINALTKKLIKGKTSLKLFRADNMKDITNELVEKAVPIPFSVKKGSSATSAWKIKVPDNLSGLVYRIVSSTKQYGDGQEGIIPVLSNKVLVTESIALSTRKKEKKSFVWEKFVKGGNGITNYKFTFEFSPNPAWYAVQALPYLMEYPYECSEQTFNRYYANALSSHIVQSKPKIKKIFSKWKNSKTALLSNLQKNQELKTVLLEETPWVLQAENEAARKKRLGLLFDINRIASEQNKALEKVLAAQAYNGGWPWFKGMPENRYITTYIISGLGHLKKLGVLSSNNNQLNNVAFRALDYLAKQIDSDYARLLEHKVDLSKNHIGSTQLYFFYASSFYPEYYKDLLKKSVAIKYYFKQLKTYWNGFSYHSSAMASLALHRLSETQTAKKVLTMLRENSLEHKELGTYWKYDTGYYWYQAPIETQALIIEAFYEIEGETPIINAMKLWLLKQKQAQDWKTTRATSEAIYALLLTAKNKLLSETPDIKISLGSQVFDFSKKLKGQEAGTGYFKHTWSQKELLPEFGKVTITNNENRIAWGALYWQFFQPYDKIKSAASKLSIQKTLFTRKKIANGDKLFKIKNNAKIKTGTRITVRLILKSDRDMEYVHLKDSRAPAFEPVKVFSGYRYQDNLGYYRSTKDASMNYFISWLPRGTHVFEYDVIASFKGNFSDGIAVLQSMYAPEFNAHSSGRQVIVY